MIKLEKKISAEFCFCSDLPMPDRCLFEAAINARAKSQAPYSHYKVGASVLTYHEGAGKIFSGCNVERVSFTQTTHAEQNAIDTMVAKLGTKKILKVCVVGRPDSCDTDTCEGRFIFAPKDRHISEFSLILEQVPVPCGHCLQIIWENCMGDPSVKLMSVTSDGIVAITTIGDAFPMRFGPKDLGVEYK